MRAVSAKSDYRGAALSAAMEMKYVTELLERYQKPWSWSQLFQGAVEGLRPNSEPSDRIDSALQEVARAGASLYADATSTNGLIRPKKENALRDAIRWLEEAHTEERAERLKHSGLFNRELATPMLDRLTKDLASALMSIDGRHGTSRTKGSDAVLRGPAGLGILLTLAKRSDSTWYREVAIDVPYSTDQRQKCAARVVTSDGTLFMEWKSMTLMTESGNPKVNALTEILSPYRQHNSALTDCLRLSKSNFQGGKAIVIAGYSYKDMLLEPAIEAFEAAAAPAVMLSGRSEASFSGLSHPVHQEGKIIAWLVERKSG